MSRERAVIIGGFSESRDHLEPLKGEFENLFDHVEPLTWQQAFDKRRDLARLVLCRTVITHSAGAMFLHEGQRAIALSGPEPTHPAKSVLFAGIVALNTRFGHENEINVSILSCAEELLRHPNHLRILGRVGVFSTSERLIRAGHERFPEGRFYLPSRNDEFGFARPDAMKRAAEHGVTTDYIGNFHNYPLVNPKATVAQIRELLEAPSIAA